MAESWLAVAELCKAVAGLWKDVSEPVNAVAETQRRAAVMLLKQCGRGMWRVGPVMLAEALV